MKRRKLLQYLSTAPLAGAFGFAASKTTEASPEGQVFTLKPAVNNTAEPAIRFYDHNGILKWSEPFPKNDLFPYDID
jgi:hypothetical protein